MLFICCIFGKSFERAAMQEAKGRKKFTQRNIFDYEFLLFHLFCPLPPASLPSFNTLENFAYN